MKSHASVFQIWQTVKAAHPTMSVCEIGAQIGRMWRELGDQEKQKYNEEFTMAKVRDKKRYFCVCDNSLITVKCLPTETGPSLHFLDSVIYFSVRFENRKVEVGNLAVALSWHKILSVVSAPGSVRWGAPAVSETDRPAGFRPSQTEER